MATGNLSAYDNTRVPDAGKMKFGIVVSDWNSDITLALLDAAVATLLKHGAGESNIIVRHVPGSYELTRGATLMAKSGKIDAVICLGCVIQGETPHFTYICQGVTAGITRLNIEFNIPFIFGVLTTDTRQQAVERAGGRHGNKGTEAAISAIKMVALQREMEG
jgi:6,7-dimethyl-8-ribityllumazine synthase